MGAGGGAPGKIPVVLVLFFKAPGRSGAKAKNQNHFSFPKGAAAPGPRFKPEETVANKLKM
jgi:hypothetical protein